MRKWRILYRPAVSNWVDRALIPVDPASLYRANAVDVRLRLERAHRLRRLDRPADDEDALMTMRLDPDCALMLRDCLGLAAATSYQHGEFLKRAVEVLSVLEPAAVVDLIARLDSYTPSRVRDLFIG